MKRLFPWALLGLIVACGDNKSESDGPPPEPFVLPPADQVLDVVTMHIEPGILSTGASADGHLRVMAPTNAVSEPTDITIGKLAASARPDGVVGDVYVLGPSTTTLLLPLRLRLDHTGSADGLRIVQLDTGAASYRVLDRWAYVAGTGTFAGSTTALGAFAVADASGSPFTNDRTPTAVGVANEALAQRAVLVARDLYEAAATADPNDLQAHFGAAVTRVVLLPEHQAVDDVLTLCAQPLVDIQGILLGADGVIAHAIEDRQGSSTLAAEAGTNISNLAATDLVPNEIQARFEEDYWDVGQDNVRVRIADREWGDTGHGLRLSFGIDPQSAGWTDGGDIDIGSMPGNAWADLWFPDEEEYVGPGWTEVRPASGTVHVVDAGVADGDPIEIELQNVVFEEVENDGSGNETVIAVYRFNGTVTDTLHTEFEPDSGTVPFMDLTYDDGPPERSEPVQLIEACGATFTQTYIKARLTALAGELDTIQTHLDAIGNHPQADTFSWKLPVGTIGNGVEIPVGVVEVHAARAFLNLVDAMHGLIDAYNIIDPTQAISDLFSDHNRYDTWCSWDCSGGPCVEVCTTDTYQVHDIDLGLLHTSLTGYFLTPAVGATFGADDVAPVKTSLQAALGAGIAALSANPSEEVLFNFRVDASAATAADELIAFGDNLLTSMTSDVTLANTPEWVLHPHAYFTDPFTAASLLLDPDVDALWDYTAPVEPAGCDPSCENAELVPNGNMAFTALESFVTLPSWPDNTIYCTGDGQCTGQSYWQCSGYEDEGVCANDMSTPCWSWDDCSGGSVECIHDVCEPREPEFFDYDLVGDAYENPSGDGPPRFMNEALADEIGEGF